MNFLSLGNSTVAQPTTLIDSPDFADACFAVTSRPLGYNESGSFVPINRTAIVRQDNQEVLHVASDHYTLIRNADVLAGLDDLYAAGYDQVKVRKIFNRQFYFELSYDPPAGSDLIIGGLPCRTRVRIINSYDGKLQFGLQFGVYIKVCSNGLCLNLREIDLQFKHSSFVPADISTWIWETTQNAVPLISKKLETVVFDDDPDSATRKLERIAKLFPDTRKQEIHPVIQRIIAKANDELSNPRTNGNQNFALMMALTNIATFPDANGVAPSYVEKLETMSTELFTV